MIEYIINILNITALILLLLSGVKITINSFHFEWVGIMEQILNAMYNRIDNLERRNKNEQNNGDN